MKKLMAFTWMILCGMGVYAQKAAITNPVNDTVKASIGKVKLVNGVKMTSSNDIIENITLSKDYTTLVTVINDAGLTETFKSKGPITVFAPTNQAFDKMPAGQLDSLLKPSQKDYLNYLVTYHAIAGRLTAKDIAHKINSNNGEATFITLAGSKITAKIDENRNIVLIDENGGQSIISSFDIEQRNGLLDVVTAVLVPKPRTI
jgi:uncharacterized surface protein with fasciclin (FAS1) repeats